MPILEVVAGGYLVGKGAMIMSAAVGGTLALAGNYLFGGHSSSNKEALATLVKAKEGTEKERMQHLDEVVKGIQQRKEELDTSIVQQQSEIQALVQGVGTDGAAIQRQADQIVPLSVGLEETARAQQELINRLQQELQTKQLAFEEAQRQLAESDARLREASKELVETKEQTETSKAELVLVRRELIDISNKKKEKDSRLDMLEKRISAQEISFEKTIKAVKTENAALLNDLKEAQQLIDELSQQLEQAQENNRSRSPSPSFFK